MVAQQLASLSLLSGGRVIFGAGIGGKPDEFTRFGDPGDDRPRAAMLDEGLELVDALLSGPRVEHRGEHYRADGVTLAPVPVRPVPFWIGGNSRPALRRAERWGGWLADGSDAERNVLSPDASVAAKLAPVRVEEVAFIGFAGQADLASYAAAGVTWWIENVSDGRGGVDGVLELLAEGPPGETLLT